MTMDDKGVANNAANDQTGKAGKTGNIRHYADERIDVSYDATRCIHAAECVHGLPAVFDTARRPWILPSGADADAIAAVVAKCPTGALHATRLDGGPAEDVPSENVDRPDAQRPALRSRPASRCDAGSRRDARRRAGGAVPLRSVAEQAVLRQQPSRRRVSRCGRDRGCERDGESRRRASTLGTIGLPRARRCRRRCRSSPRRMGHWRSKAPSPCALPMAARGITP